VNAVFGNIGITDKGIAYLSDPRQVRVNSSLLIKSWFEIELIQALKQVRKEKADQAGVAPFRLYTNYTLSRLVATMPRDADRLEEIEGLRNASPQLKQLILAEIRRVLAKKEKDEASGGVFSRAYSSSHRKVKALYESGFDPGEIARRRKLSPEKVDEYLETLHRAGEIDLRPWIEEAIDSKDLHKGSEYFKQVTSPRLKEAKAVLGLDYETLRMCRLYALDVGE
jgi:hypothetical protein